MAFLRSVALTPTTAIVVASAIPLAYSLSSRSSSSRSFKLSKPQNLHFLSLTPNRFCLVRQPLSALPMAGQVSEETPSSKSDGALLPELLTEYMVDMTCEGCVNSVKNKLQTVDGIKNVEVDFSNQVVRIRGSSPVKTMTEAFEQIGRKARLIGQGVPDDFLISAAVAEFKGPGIYGVVRFAQVNMELARIEANFSGLTPGTHGWSINEFGDLTRGVASTGKVFNPISEVPSHEPVGDLRTLDADEKGEAFFTGVKDKLRVRDLIGRSIALYGTDDKSDSGLAAAVIARSAGVGENYKQLCSCDGTTIWEATNNDFVKSKV